METFESGNERLVRRKTNPLKSDKERCKNSTCLMLLEKTLLFFQGLPPSHPSVQCTHLKTEHKERLSRSYKVHRKTKTDTTTLQSGLQW
jgi:hypothetical protein